MREIKFEAFVNWKYLIDVDSMTWENGKVLAVHWLLAPDTEWHWFEDFILREFTWLTDKNWVDEIYEYDIVQSNYGTYTIIWEDWAFYMNNKTSRYPMINNTKVQIIWNIYQSPELLTK